MTEEQHFEKLTTVKQLTDNLYENCSFKNCHFAQGDFSNISFIDCEFIDCDLSNARVTNTAFKTVKFEQSKLIGIHFEDCNTFLLDLCFTDCTLNISSFYQLNLKKSVFTNCSLHEVDFTETNLAEANFTNCDFIAAIFENTNLEKADFRTSTNYAIRPDMNRVKGAHFSADGLAGLLYHHQIKIS